MFSCDMEPKEYAALWGCDPCYDRAPRLPGDGYLFYNYGAEQTPDFLRRFIPAIERTILLVQQEPDTHEPEDEDDLRELLEFVKEQAA